VSDSRAGQIQVIDSVLQFVQVGQFAIVEYRLADAVEDPPYAQAAREPSGWYLEVVSEFYLPRDVWPIDELALRREGWLPPADVEENWWMRLDGSASLHEVARHLVDGLAQGRCCAGDGELSISIGTFPSGPDGGLPLPGLADAA